MGSRNRAVRAILGGLWLAAAVVSCAVAQGRGSGGPPPGGPGGMGGGMNGGASASYPGGAEDRGNPRNNGAPPPPSLGGQPAPNTTRPGVQLGPPGRWWDDKGFAKNLKLRPEQQTHMDAIFEQNRSVLVARYHGLEQAETQMDQLSKSAHLDEPALFSQIDRVAQARADLEKATTHMLLLIRKEMDPDQIARLEKHH